MKKKFAVGNRNSKWNHCPNLGFGVTKNNLITTPYFRNRCDYRRHWGTLAERGIKMSEIVYVFTNPAMPGFIKIGMTTRDDVKQRLKELSSPTGVPVPFECPYAAGVRNASEAEKAIHDAFAEKRLPRREFFTIPEEKVIALLKQMAISDATPATQKILDEITSQEDKLAQATAKARRSNLTFSEINIPLGAELTFKPDPTKKCRVVDDKNQVEYEGATYNFSDLAMKLLRERDNTRLSPYAQGAYWFTYEGKRLTERRDELENEGEPA